MFSKRLEEFISATSNCLKISIKDSSGSIRNHNLTKKLFPKERKFPTYMILAGQFIFLMYRYALKKKNEHLSTN